MSTEYFDVINEENNINNTEVIDKTAETSSTKDKDNLPNNKDVTTIISNKLIEILHLNNDEIDIYNKILNNENKNEPLIINLDSPDYGSDEYKSLQNRYINNLINYYIVEYIENNENVDFESLQEYLNMTVPVRVDNLKENDIFERIDEVISNPNYRDIKIQQKLFQLLNKKSLIKRYIKTLDENNKENTLVKDILTKISLTIADIQKENYKISALSSSNLKKENIIKTAQNRVSELEELNEQAETEIANLKKQMESIEYNNNENNIRLKELQEENERLNSEIQILYDNINENDNPEIVEENETLKQEKDELENKITLLEEQSSVLTGELETLKQEKDELEEQNTTFSDELENLKNVKNVDIADSVELKTLKEENEILKQKNSKLEKELFDVAKNSEPVTDTLEDKDEEYEIEKNSDGDLKETKKDKKPKSKILKYILIGISSLFGLIILWFIYALFLAPTNTSTPIQIQKVAPQKTVKKPVVVATQSYDFNKKLSKEEFEKQKFDIYKDNRLKCRVNNKEFHTNDIINGWRFRKTMPEVGQLVFTDIPDTYSIVVQMETK